MSAERKKVEKKPIPKVEPKKRQVVESPKVEEPIIESPKVEEPEVKFKRSENKYVKFLVETKGEDRKIISDKINKGEIKFAHYGLDGDKGYHYFIKLRN